jgi:hypothetical protein
MPAKAVTLGHKIVLLLLLVSVPFVFCLGLRLRDSAIEEMIENDEAYWLSEAQQGKARVYYPGEHVTEADEPPEAGWLFVAVDEANDKEHYYYENGDVFGLRCASCGWLTSRHYRRNEPRFLLLPATVTLVPLIASTAYIFYLLYLSLREKYTN